MPETTPIPHPNAVPPTKAPSEPLPASPLPDAETAAPGASEAGSLQVPDLVTSANPTPANQDSSFDAALTTLVFVLLVGAAWLIWRRWRR